MMKGNLTDKFHYSGIVEYAKGKNTKYVSVIPVSPDGNFTYAHEGQPISIPEFVINGDHQQEVKRLIDETIEDLLAHKNNERHGRFESKTIVVMHKEGIQKYEYSNGYYVQIGFALIDSKDKIHVCSNLNKTFMTISVSKLEVEFEGVPV